MLGFIFIVGFCLVSLLDLVYVWWCKAYAKYLIAYLFDDEILVGELCGCWLIIVELNEYSVVDLFMILLFETWLVWWGLIIISAAMYVMSMIYVWLICYGWLMIFTCNALLVSTCVLFIYLVEVLGRYK